MSNCIGCGAALSAEAKFCSGCGLAVDAPSTCLACGAALAAGARFCSACGASQLGEAISIAMAVLSHPVCRYCKSRRPPDAPRPPNPVFHPSGIEVLEDFNKKMAEIALTEQRVLDAGQDFTYKPQSLEWCEAHTRRKNRKVYNPVTGEQGRVYVPCARGNANARCDLFDPLDGMTIERSPDGAGDIETRSAAAEPVLQAAADTIQLGMECALVGEFGQTKVASDPILRAPGPNVPPQEPRPPDDVLKDGFDRRFRIGRLAPGEEPIVIGGEGLKLSYGVMGSPGSGKTNLLMHLLHQIARLHGQDENRKFGGLILDPKAALIDDVQAVFAAAGRSDDLIVVNEEHLEKNGQPVNILDCSLDAGGLGNALSLAAQSAGISSKEPYWLNQIRTLAESTLALLRFDRPWRGTTETMADLTNALLGQSLDEGGQRQSNLRFLIDIAKLKSRGAAQYLRKDLELHISILESHLDGTDPRNRTTTEAFLNQAFGRFRFSNLSCYSAAVASGSAEAAGLYDRAIAEGKFILVSVSRQNLAASRMLCTIIKVLFQQTVLTRKERHDRGELAGQGRPLLFFADEYSDVATEVPGNSMGDPTFVSLAREFLCMILLATQNVQMLKTSGLGENEGAWKSVLGNLAATIFLSNADPETADHASKLLGEAQVMSRVLNQTMGGDGVSHTVDLSLEEKKSLEPEVVLRAFKQGQGVVVGKLDGVDQPRARFIAAPYWRNGLGYREHPDQTA